VGPVSLSVPAPQAPGPRDDARPLRIGVEAHVVGRRQTGNERVMSNLITALGEVSGHRLVVYFTLPEAAAEWRSRAGGRLEIRMLRPTNPFVRIPLALPWLARRDRLDVLLSHVNAPPVAPCPVVTLIHDVAFARHPEYFSRLERAYMNRTVPASMRWSDAVITVSGFTRDEVVALYGIPAAKITVAHNGVDPQFLDGVSRSAPVEPPFFLAIGNLQPRKNLVTLIRAYRRLVRERPDVPERLVIVGKEFFRAGSLYAEADELRRAGRIVFTGYLADDELVGLLQRATAFAYPSVYEGFGLTVVEAMAVGAPAMAADIPVMREVAGADAMLLPVTDEAAWADGLARMASDQALRSSLAARGRERAAGFSWERSARAVVSTLERAARRAR